jgi:heterodisulfide reductase subunit A-like polyferredoxin
MRKLALARTLVSRGDVDDTVVALCAPQAHRAIWRRWAEAKAHLAGAGIALADIAAEAVASAQASSAALGARYLLELGTEA